MGWVIAIAALALLMFVPVGVHAAYNSAGGFAWLLIGPIRFPIFPRRKQPYKSKEKRNKTAKKDPEKRIKHDERPSGKLSDFFPLVRLVFNFFVDFRRKLRIDSLAFKVILAGEDPCDLAVNYGRAWAALGNLMPQLEQLFTIKKRDLEVACDFLASETRIKASVDMSLTVWDVLCIAVYHGTRILRKYLKIINKSKAV